MDTGIDSVELDRYIFREIDQNELLESTKIPELDLSREFVENSLFRGEKCFGALKGGELIGYTWVTTLPAYVNGQVRVIFPKGAIYNYKSFVLPQHRGRNTVRKLYTLSLRSFMDDGNSIGVGYIETHNYPSLKASDKEGHQTVGYAAYISKSDFFSVGTQQERKRSALVFTVTTDLFLLNTALNENRPRPNLAVIRNKIRSFHPGLAVADCCRVTR